MKQRVLVFSVDAMVYEDLQHLRGCRNTKKYFQNACGVRHIRSIYPTVTYPAHTTILTGCYPASHGVISNTHFTTGSTEYEWLWDAGNGQGAGCHYGGKGSGVHDRCGRFGL
mgnify:CR=1 FL=1